MKKSLHCYINIAFLYMYIYILLRSKLSEWVRSETSSSRSRSFSMLANTINGTII